MKLSALLAPIAFAASIQACYITIHSSTVGNFNVQHSEPSDHGGARQFVSFTKGGCTVRGELLNGCTIKTSSTKGCGSVSFSITHPGRFVRDAEIVKSEE